MAIIPCVYLVTLNIAGLPAYSESGLDLDEFVSREINPRAEPLLARLGELGVNVRSKKLSRSLLIMVDASPEKLEQAKNEGLIFSFTPNRDDVELLEKVRD